MSISSASFAYPHHGDTVRAEMAVRLNAGSLPAGAFVLSTCLRMEITVAGDRSELERALLATFGELGDSALWRHIADENNLDNPMDLRPGQVLGISIP